MARKTQKDMILQYIRDTGSISSWEAYSELGITQLGARIWELHHNLKYNFRKERVTKTNRYGQKIRFDRYFLVED